jgi:hypothetical protein
VVAATGHLRAERKLTALAGAARDWRRVVVGNGTAGARDRALDGRGTAARRHLPPGWRRYPWGTDGPAALSGDLPHLRRGGRQLAAS